MLELPDQVRPVIGNVFLLFAMPKLAPVHRRGRSLPLDAVVERSKARFPHSELAWIETPASPTAAVRINLWQPGEPSRRFPCTNVWLDPYTGAVLATRDGRQESGGDVVLDWLHPLHGGEAFGLLGRLLVLLSGLLATALAITGWWRWKVRRRRAPSR